MTTLIDWVINHIPIILSTISILLTTISSIKTIKINKKLNSINLESEYFDYLFKELLLKSIPMARAKLTINSDGKLTGIDDLLSTLTEARLSLMYYQYTDNNFYKQAKNKIQEIEDFLCHKGDEVLIAEEGTDFFNQLQEHLKVLYALMLKKFKGT